MNCDNVLQKSDEVFLTLEQKARETFSNNREQDRMSHSDGNSRYFGNYDPERTYMATVAAILNRTGVDLEPAEEHFNFNPHTITNNVFNFDDETLLREFGNFFQGINYIIADLRAKELLYASQPYGTSLQIENNYRDEINNLLEKIEKIVRQEVHDVKLREAIFEKIASLRLQINRERTTLDAYLSAALDVSRTLRQVAKDINPLSNVLERMNKLIWNSGEESIMLPEEQIHPRIEQHSGDLDDDIPF